MASISPSKEQQKFLPPSNPEAALHATLKSVMRDSLLPVSTWLSLLFVVMAISHQFFLKAAAAGPMSLVAVCSAVALFVLRLALIRAPLAEKWVCPMAAAIAGLVLLNSLLHIYLTGEPMQTTNVVLLVIGVGFLFLSSRWLAVILLAVFSGWSLVVWKSSPSSQWPHFGFALFTATILAIIIHAARVRTTRRLASLHLQDERQKTDLEAALAKTEEARRRAESSQRELMQSEARMRLLTSQMPAILWSTDADLRFTSCLGLGLTVLHLQPNQIVGMPLTEFLREASPEFMPIAAHHRARQGESVSFLHTWNHRLFDAQIEPLHDAENNIIGVIGVALDITERKQSEEQIQTSFKEKERLLKEVHYRVKNNLQLITSLLNLQAGYLKDEAAREVFRESQDRMKALALLHEKLYTADDLTSIEIAGYVRNLTAHLFRSHKINTHAISLQLNMAPIILDIDRAISCGLIINELVANALKYAFPHEKAGEIRVDFQQQNQQNSLVVSDNGVGFAKGVDFRSADSLGFQLITILVDQLQGTITLDQNKGTTFKILFRH